MGRPLAPAEQRLLRVCALLKLAATRDKLLKCTQYSIRLYVWLARRFVLTGDRELLARLHDASNSMSKARRVLWVLGWIDGYFSVREALQEEAWSDRVFGVVAAATDFFSDSCDDLCTVEEYGLIRRGTLPEAVELVADRSWWFSTLLGIFAGGVSLRRQRARVAALEGAEEIGAEEDLDGPTRAQALAQAREKLLLAQISQLKLALDLVPSTEYAFEPGLPPICVTLASLLSGLLSTYKMFRVGPPPALCDE